MKRLLCYLMLVVSLCLGACNDEDKVMEQSPVVTYASLAGTWRLAEWNGTEMDEHRYCYLIIQRRPDEETGERLLEMYTNIDSDKSHYVASVYKLEEDEELGTIISGRYAHAAGFWNNSYRVSMEVDRMVWRVSDDADDVSIYVRCESVPDDILAGTRAVSN